MYVCMFTQVTDLLISTTFAAALGDHRRFEPFPFGVEAVLPGRDGQPAITLNFVAKPAHAEASGSGAAEVQGLRKNLSEVVRVCR